MPAHGSAIRYECKNGVAILSTDSGSAERYVSLMPIRPANQWVIRALEHSGLEQSDLNRQLAGRLKRKLDRTVINKIITDKRAVAADEMLAIEAVTGYPIPSPSVVTRVPILDTIQAGQFSPTFSYGGGGETVGVTDLGAGDFFAFRVSGDSMDRVSPEGSIIIADRDDRTLIAERFYIFSWQGELTYKQWRDDPARLSPYSTTGRHDAIFIRNKRGLEILGRVRRTLLDL